MSLRLLNLVLAAATLASAVPAPPPLSARAATPSTTAQFASTTTFSFTGTTLPSGLTVITQTIGSTPMEHDFEPSNVAVSGGYLTLTVPGGQNESTSVSSAQVITSFDMMYASVQTTAILTKVAGVCNGMFLYRSDNQETDIEWISDPNSDSNAGTASIHYTNQALNSSVAATTETGAVPSDATSNAHVYRHDWTAASTNFYIDGKLKQTITSNVPTESGPWMWNNWADGNADWTMGPPETDAVFKIQQIVIAYNPA